MLLTLALGNLVIDNIPGIQIMPSTGTMKRNHRVTIDAFSRKRYAFET
jgi:ribosomal protein L32